MTAVLRLESHLDTRAAMDLSRHLRDVSSADLAVVASETAHIGAQALQTLMVAAANWSGSGNGFSITGVSEDLKLQVQLFGVDPTVLRIVEPD